MRMMMMVRMMMYMSAWWWWRGGGSPCSRRRKRTRQIYDDAPHVAFRFKHSPTLLRCTDRPIVCWLTRAVSDRRLRSITTFRHWGLPSCFFLTSFFPSMPLAFLSSIPFFCEFHFHHFPDIYTALCLYFTIKLFFSLLGYFRVFVQEVRNSTIFWHHFG